MSQPEIPPFISELTGPLFLGLIFNWALFGALSVQVYIYYLAFPRDRPFPTKAIVAFVFVYDAIQTFLITRDGFKYFGSGWGDMRALNEVGWVWISVPLMTGIISAITQIFYAWRIWILSRRRYISAFVILIAPAQGAAGIWNSVEAYETGIWSELQTRSSTSATLWLGGTAICDVVIAASMLYYLSQSRNAFRHTNALLIKLIRITVETGFITAAVAVVDLSLFLAFKNTNYHLAPAISLSKLYSNSLMALLNARLRIVDGRGMGVNSGTNHDPTLGQSSSTSNRDQSTVSANTSFAESWDFKSRGNTRDDPRGSSFLQLGGRSRGLGSLRFEHGDSGHTNKLSLDGYDIESFKGYPVQALHIPASRPSLSRVARPLPSIPQCATSLNR